MHHALPLFLCRTTAPYCTGGGGALNDAGFQIMSKQSTAQGWVKKPDKSAPSGTPGGLNDAGFQIMSKQSTAQWRVKKPDKCAPGGTPVGLNDAGFQILSK